MKPQKRTPKTLKLKPKKKGEICNSESLNSRSFPENNLKFKSVSLTPGEGSISMNLTRNKDVPRDNNVSDISFSQNSSDQETELHKVVDNIITDLVSHSDDKNVLSRNEVEKVPSNLKKTEDNAPLNSSGIPCILNGVTAFVEVRSDGENQSEAIEHKLQVLGAKISKRLNKKVTHVVFKEGRMSTRKKAVSQGIHIVSVLWVESCRQKQEKVPEYLFQSIPKEDTEILLIPRRVKKFRCMKPKNFSQEFAGSAEKLKKIFSRIKGAQGEIKSNSPVSALEHSVENAENHKPGKEIYSKILQTPTRETSTSQKRKLFDDKLESEQASVKKKVQHISKEEIQPSKKHISNKRKLFDAQQAYSYTALESLEVKVTKSVNNYGNIISGKGDKNWTQAEDFNKLTVESHCEILDSCKKLDKAEKCKGKKVKKTTRGNYVHCKKSVNTVNVSENKSGCIQNGNLGKGLSYKNGFNTSENTLSKIPEHVKSYRHSMDDFKIDKKKKNIERPNEWIELSHESEKADLLPSLTTKENNNQEKNLLKNIVLTSVNPSEQESIYSIVKALGGFIITDSVTKNTTHVICGDRKRTLNVLFALAQGCWLLSPKWVYKSLEAGCWLEEEAFELCDYFPAVQICRTKRTSLGTSSNLFRDLGPIYISDHSVPPRDKLSELVTIAGGKVTSCFRQCSIAVGMLQTRHTASIKVVTEKWILDCISNHKILPLFTAPET